MAQHVPHLPDGHVAHLPDTGGDEPGITVPDVVGNDQATGTSTLEGAGFVVAVQTAYSASVPAGSIISQQPAGGAEAAEGSTVTITVSLGVQPQSAEDSAAGFYWEYRREQERRKRERKRREELEEETRQIEEETSRKIAELLRKQEAEDARRDELARLSALVARHASRASEAELGARVHRAVAKAAEKRTVWALFQLERELRRAQEEEDFLMEAARIIFDD